MLVTLQPGRCLQFHGGGGDVGGSFSGGGGGGGSFSGGGGDIVVAVIGRCCNVSFLLLWGQNQCGPDMCTCSWGHHGRKVSGLLGCAWLHC